MKPKKLNRLILAAVATYSRRFALTAAAVLGLTATSQAAIVFTDTFDSGTGAWYRAGTANTLTNSSGQLSWSTGLGSGLDQAHQVIGRSFTSTSLGVGETMRLTFDITQSGTTSLGIVRVGLFDVTTPITGAGWSTNGTLIGNFTGYSSFVRDNVATGNPARYESATDTNSDATGPTVTFPATAEIGNNNTVYDIAQSITYQGVFDVTRTSLTQMDTLFTLSDGVNNFSLSGTTSNIVGSFDTVVFRMGPDSGTATALYDNVQLQVIPEPSTALLGGLGLLVLLRRRRA